VLDFFTKLFQTDFMPHAHCYLWKGEVLWLAVIADLLIFLAYLSIPFLLVRLVRIRPDLSFNGIFYLFSAFIVLCGLTHAMSILTLWTPIYRAEGLLKLLTGIVSLGTAYQLGKLMPIIRTYPSPRDLSEANARLVELNEQLESRIAQRTEELARARDAALEANEAKSWFLAAMSHEIRTPLNGVIGAVRLLADTRTTAEQKELLSAAQLSGQALLSVIQDALDFSKIEAGKLTIERAPLSLKQLVEDSLSVVQGQAMAKKIVLRHSLHPDLAELVEGDNTRLRQVLLNLLSNAIKFTDHGSVEVAVRPSGGTNIEFSVSDTGIGISDKNRDRVFEAFTQVETNASRRHGGTGLGLAICKRLVELMGGSIQLESEPGKGSTFRFALPMPIANSRPEIGEMVLPPNPSPCGHHILVAEDNAVNQLVIRKLLEKLGYTVDLAGDGVEVVKAAQAKQYALILMDCQMPNQDGYTATREIRRIERSKGVARTPILALTANVVAGIREQCLAAGMDDYLSKPVSEELLAQVLARWSRERN
jgi:signal transduction histidine kinase/ActR/RegA family two-component response regulator